LRGIKAREGGKIMTGSWYRNDSKNKNNKKKIKEVFSFFFLGLYGSVLEVRWHALKECVCLWSAMSGRERALIGGWGCWPTIYRPPKPIF
jgi:hypothetical protein